MLLLLLLLQLAATPSSIIHVWLSQPQQQQPVVHASFYPFISCTVHLSLPTYLRTYLPRQVGRKVGTYLFSSSFFPSICFEKSCLLQPHTLIFFFSLSVPFIFPLSLRQISLSCFLLRLSCFQLFYSKQILGISFQSSNRFFFRRMTDRTSTSTTLKRHFDDIRVTIKRLFNDNFPPCLQ